MDKNILKKIARLDDGKAEKSLFDVAQQIFLEIKKPGNEAKIYSQLDLLEAFSYRVPDLTLEIIDFVIKNKCKEELSDKNWINYGTIVSKCFEILKGIRYLKTEKVFELLINFNPDVKRIQENKDETLKSLLQYNFNVLKQIGLSVQVFLLNKMQAWSKEEKLKNIEVIKLAVKELLQPSYEWSNLVEWNKLQFSRGSLIGDKSGNLAKIRKESIDLIFETYRLVDDEKVQLQLVDVLDEASRTSHIGSDESLEAIIKENIEYLIKEYAKIAFGDGGLVICSLPVAMEIEKQLLWFKKRWKDEIEGIDKLISKLKKDKKYNIYSQLVDRTRLDYLEYGKKQSKIINFEKDILPDKTLLDILNDIAEAAKIEENWKFNDFHAFLTDITEKDVKRGEYFLNDAIKDNLALINFADAFIIGFRNVGRFDLWDKFVSQVEKKKNITLISKILNSFYFHFKNTKDPKFRKKDFSWIKNIANREKRYSFLIDESDDRYYFDYILFRTIILLWKYEKKDSEALLINEIKKSNIQNLSQKLEEIELYISWKEFSLAEWDKGSIDYLVKCVIKSKRLDYHIQGLVIEIGKINFNYVFNIIKGRLDLVRKKDLGDYDAMPMRLEENFVSFIDENKSVFNKEIVNFIESQSRETTSFYELTSLLYALGGIYKEVLNELMEDERGDNFEKVVDMLRTTGSADLGLCAEVAEKIIESKKMKAKLRKTLLNRIGSAMYSTGVVSGEHGFSNAMAEKAKTLSEMKKKMKKYKKSDLLISFIDDKIRYFKQSAKNEKIREEREIKMREIDFKS